MSVFEKLIPQQEREKMKVGDVFSVTASAVTVVVKEAERLNRARVGRLAVVKGRGDDEWLVGLVTRMWRRQPPDRPRPGDIEGDPGADKEEQDQSPDHDGLELALLGTYQARVGSRCDVFTRSVLSLPALDAAVVPLEDAILSNFMAILAVTTKASQATPLEVGHFTLGGNARAYLDGNRLFQRHAALVGSTGSGKSWAVASLLERAAKLPNANIVLFDLHGEYRSLSFARRLRIAGPTDLAVPRDGVIFLPYWLLDFDELQEMMVDRSEFTAHNQVMQVHAAVAEEKRRTLKDLNKHDVLRSFTVDSPVPFDLAAVIHRIDELNSEMTQGVKGMKQGPYFGQFSRLLDRLERRRADRRYGFMYQAPPEWLEYEALHRLVRALMAPRDGATGQAGIKVIDFSEVPSDVLPVMVSLVARLIFQVQLWTKSAGEGNERHPILLVCDEAHLYLPASGENLNPLQRRALHNFERIAKEGRKYGVGLLVVSQRPADLSDSVLSQCNNFLCLRLGNPADQGAVRKLLPEGLASLMDVLPMLNVGEVLVMGDAILLPMRIQLDPPSFKPLSGTIDFWDRWADETVEDQLVDAVEAMRRQGPAGEAGP